MKQHTSKMAQTEYSYYSFIKASFAGLIRVAHRSEGVLDF